MDFEKKELFENELKNAEEKDSNNNIVKKDITQKPFKLQIVWKNVILFAIGHVFAIYGGYLFATSNYNFKPFGFIWCLSLTLPVAVSVTMGAHRLWAHKTFKAKPGLKLILLILQTISAENCLWVWVRDHRQHHKYSDTDADPHNATNGFFFSHIGWLMCKKHPDVIRLGKKIDMSDLNADKMIMFQKRHYKKLFFLLGFCLPVLVPVYFGEDLFTAICIHLFFRSFVINHLVWCINSVSHLFGPRPYSKHISPVESPMMSVLGLGEGYHNYHHTFPWDYKASEFGEHYSLTTSVIDFCAKYGWAYDLVEAKTDLIKYRVENFGDGTHNKYTDGRTEKKEN